jgi:Bacterial Ig domain
MSLTFFIVTILILISFFYQSLSYLFTISSFQNYHTIVAFVGQNTTSNENHTPMAEDMTILTNSSNPVRFTLKAQDEDNGDKLNYSIVAEPKQGEVGFFDSTTGDIIYNPGSNFKYFNDSLAFRVNDDNDAVSNPGLVIIKPGPK